MTAPLRRQLVAYRANGDEPAWIHDFDDALVPALLPFFDIGDDTEMVHAYRVGADIRGPVAGILGVALDPGFDHYIETSA